MKTSLRQRAAWRSAARLPTVPGDMRHALLPLALLLAACGAGEAPETSGTLRIDALAEPDPPHVGPNALVVQVRDRDGSPVTGAALTVEAFMPGMGHGSTETTHVTETGGGAYHAEPVTYHMAGTWQVTVEATAAGEEGAAVFHFEVER